jgi:hypothetical protein
MSTPCRAVPEVGVRSLGKVLRQLYFLPRTMAASVDQVILTAGQNRHISLFWVDPAYARFTFWTRL